MTRGLYAGENVVIVTGLPGRGKTLLALWLVDRIANGRPVYVAGVRGLKLREGWQELEDRSKWHECPSGSVVLIDEGQECFRPAGSGSAVPEHVAKMERIRHTGITLVITTQHPMLVHSNVRKLAQVHLHLVRKFGSESATVYRWDMVADVGTRNALLSSVKTASKRVVWPYPKEVYGWYESAELHTVQKKLPWQKVALYVIPVLVIGLLVVGYQAIRNMQNRPAEIAAKAAGTDPAAQTAGNQSGGPGPVKTRAQWLDERTPRIQGLAHTAPAFDQVTKPAHAPYPAACVVMRGECRCYSEQATRLDVSASLCTQIVERGFYIEWDTAHGGGDRKQARADERRVSDARPTTPAPELVAVAERPGGAIASSGSYSGVPPLGR